MKITKTNRQVLEDLSGEQRDLIKEHLTFDNPAYKQAKRYSRSKYISIPPYLTCYDEYSVKSNNGERKKVLSVPIGVNVPKILKVSNFDFNDGRNEVKVNYPKFNLVLREDQIRAEKDYLKEVTRDTLYPKCIIQLPTGKGKSILALHIAYVLQQKTLVLVHKDDLVVGWKKDIELCFGNSVDVGLIKAKSRKVGEHITISTIQTLGRMSDDELSNYINQFGLVVSDEVHHTNLNYFSMVDKFNSKFKLGLSATPKREDGLNFVFELFFGGLCYKHIVTEDDEDICNCEVRVLDSNYKYEPFIYNNQVFNTCDFNEEDLPKDITYLSELRYEERPRIPFLTIDDAVVRSPKTKVLVCKKIIEHFRQGHSIIALFTQKEHINIYYRHLCRYIPKDQIMLYYGDSKEKSEDMMRKAENKEVLVTLATYAKATEGTNVKSWEVEFLVSSVNNEKNVEQATGRIRRRKEGKLSPVIVYDVRYDDCYSLSKHYNTRLQVYKRLNYEVVDPRCVKTKAKSSLFSRGYNS